jgi:hypothetical protein
MWRGSKGTFLRKRNPRFLIRRGAKKRLHTDVSYKYTDRHPWRKNTGGENMNFRFTACCTCRYSLFRQVSLFSSHDKHETQTFRSLRLSEFPDKRHMKMVRLPVLHNGRLYPQERSLVFISVRGWVDPRAIVRPEGLSHWKIPATPSGIEPATFRFAVRCSNLVPPRYCWELMQMSATSRSLSFI